MAVERVTDRQALEGLVRAAFFSEGSVKHTDAFNAALDVLGWTIDWRAPALVGPGACQDDE